MPGVSGQIDIPILMVTAKTESVDKIRGLGLGADDYIVKPFDPMELVARVKSHLARYARLTHKGEKTEEEEYDANDYILQIGDLKIMTKSWKVIKGGEEIHFQTGNLNCSNILHLIPILCFPRSTCLSGYGDMNIHRTLRP